MPRINPPRAPDIPPAAPPAPAAGGRPQPAAAAAPVGASTAPNPALRMDPELGLVVLEFRNARGEVEATFPTSRELDAYRRAARTGAPSPDA